MLSVRLELVCVLRSTSHLASLCGPLAQYPSK